MSSVQEFLLSFYRSPYHIARSTDNRFGKLVLWKAAAAISFFSNFTFIRLLLSVLYVLILTVTSKITSRHSIV